MESRPPVSLGGRSGEDRAPDVLNSGSKRDPRSTPAVRRRLRLGCVVTLVAIAAVTGVLEVQERRQVAAEERRLAGLLRLSSPDGPWQTFAAADSPSPQSVDVDMRVLVRNDGPRDVTVTQASAGAFVLRRAPVPLPAQTTAEIVLQQTFHCIADTPHSSQTTPGPWAPPGPLVITARTSRGSRTITIARPPYDTAHAARLCVLLRKPPVDDANAT